jgi:outer membrane cobalamin receptor
VLAVIKRAALAVLVLGSTRAIAQPAQPQTTPDDEELIRLANSETIEIYDERPDKPFDRDTEVRLTGEQLAALGATDLGTALALLPDVTVRDAGRGGFDVDVRGARKGAVSVFIDGVLVTDPYYGTYDVTSIPITDIVQIRIATTPQSPIDGPGGPGGVIEVHTRDAYGSQLVIARVTADTLPTFGMTGTARTPLTQHLGLRVSASGQGGARDLPLPPTTPGSVNQNMHSGTGAARLEYRDDTTRIAWDGFLDDRHYVSPPEDDMTLSPFQILLIDHETTARSSLKADEKLGKLQLQEEAWYFHVSRLSRYYDDAALSQQVALENLHGTRYGAEALATMPLGKDWRWAASATVDRETIDVATTSNDVRAGLTLAELAGDVQFERGTVRLDASAGLALPVVFGGADPWPEGKLTARWRPRFGSLELTGTLARKGRVPSLRERFDPMTGNPALGPEMIDEAEVRAIENLTDRLRIEAAPFIKHSTGTIRSSPDPALDGQLINLGTLDYEGVDLLGRVRVHPLVEIGADYDYIRVIELSTATTPEIFDPLDRLPRNRADGWVQVHPAPKVAVLARVSYSGAFVDQTVDLPGYTLVSAIANARLGKDYLAVLRLDDALNARPETRDGYHTPGRTLTLVVQGQWQ